MTLCLILLWALDSEVYFLERLVQIMFFSFFAFLNFIAPLMIKAILYISSSVFLKRSFQLGFYLDGEIYFFDCIPYLCCLLIINGFHSLVMLPVPTKKEKYIPLLVFLILFPLPWFCFLLLILLTKMLSLRLIYGDSKYHFLHKTVILDSPNWCKRCERNGNQFVIFHELVIWHMVCE